MNPEVSVIIPAYNTEAYISKAIQSALGQTLNNIEIIVVDDASIDQTLAVAKSFTDERLKVITLPQNLGAAVARNRALQVANGKWVAVLDSDDWYAPERLEKLVQVASAKDVDIIADDVYYIKDGDKVPWSSLFAQSGEQIDKIKEIDSVCFVETDLPGRGGLTLGLTKPLFKRSFLAENRIEYDENIKLGQDFWFYLKCLMHGARFLIIPKAYYFYRSRTNSLVTKNQIERLNQYCMASQDFLAKELVKNNPRLQQALLKRLELLEKTRPYFRVVDKIKNRHVLVSLFEMISCPYFFIHLFKQLPRIISRRISYYFGRKSKLKL